MNISIKRFSGDIDNEYLVVRTTGTSVDGVLKQVEELPETKEFLKESTLGLEYIQIEFNHGEDIIVKIPRYIKS